MKLHIVDVNTKKPLMNTKIQLQVKGKDGGFLTMLTDGIGMLTLDDKYLGQEMMCPVSGCSQSWVKVMDGATVAVSTIKQKSTETSHRTK